MNRPGPTSRATAYHEAAHAVVSLTQRKGRTIECIELFRSDTGWGGGVYWIEPSRPWETYDAESRRALALTIAAGRFGHERGLGDDLPAHSDEWSRDDDVRLSDAADKAVNRDAITEAIEGDLSDEAADAALEAHAELCRAWVREVKAEARALVEEHWPTVTAVADAILGAPATLTVEHSKTGEERPAAGYRLAGDEIRQVFDAVERRGRAL